MKKLRIALVAAAALLGVLVTAALFVEFDAPVLEIFMELPLSMSHHRAGSGPEEGVVRIVPHSGIGLKIDRKVPE